MEKREEKEKIMEETGQTEIKKEKRRKKMEQSTTVIKIRVKGKNENI